MVDVLDLPVNRKNSIAVARIVERMQEDLELEVIGGFQGMSRPVFSSDVNRPGLALSGYLEFFANDRIQLLGNTEINYMKTLTPAAMEKSLAGNISFELPAFVIRRNLVPENLFLDMWYRRVVPASVVMNRTSLKRINIPARVL